MSKNPPETLFPTAHRQRVHPDMVMLADFLTGRGTDAPCDCEGLVFSDTSVLVRKRGVGSVFVCCVRYADHWHQLFTVHPSDKGVLALRSSIIETDMSDGRKAGIERRRAEDAKALDETRERNRIEAEHREASREREAEQLARVDPQYLTPGELAARKPQLAPHPRVSIV